MSGLYENVSGLSNDDSLTFLLRTPKIELTSLNLRQISFNYEKYLNLSNDDAIKLAKITNGYAYGYQLLGNIMFSKKYSNINDDLLHEYDIALEDNVYSKIWKTLSQKEKQILIAIAKSDNGKTSEILDIAKIKNNLYQVYKRNLNKAGLIDDESFGKIKFTLPRFKEYVLFQNSLLEE